MKMSLFGDAPISSASSDPWSLPDGTYSGAVGEIETYHDPEGKFSCTNVSLVNEDGRAYRLRLWHPHHTDTPEQTAQKLSNIKRFYEGLEIPESAMDTATAEDIQAAGDAIVFTLKSNTAKNGKTYQNLTSLSRPRGSGMRQTVREATNGQDLSGMSEFARASGSSGNEFDL